MIPSADLDVMYELFTIAATVGGVTAAVHFRQGDADMLGDRLVREYALRFRATDFTTLARGDTVTVNAIAYKVLEVRLLDSGDEKVARVSKT